MKITTIKQISLTPSKHEFVNVLGWIQTNRCSGKSLKFLEINDGSCFENLQVILKKEETINFEAGETASFGSAILIKGVIKETPNAQQLFELQAKEIILLAKCNTANFPLQKKDISLQYLRANLSVRHRTKLHRAIQLIRKELAWSVQEFFHQLDFMWFHAPILTTNDCEGAGESFIITKQNDEFDFFSQQATLSVSGQLHAEAYALGFKNVYTFGPTFRAEQSDTNRHLAEFWMIEPEMSFASLEENIQLMENFTKHTIAHVLDKCKAELNYLSIATPENKDLCSRLNKVIKSSFKKITYEQAIADLTAAIETGVKFEYSNIFFGMDLQSEHEKYLVDVLYNAPIFVINYPASLKSFYMKLNDDNITVAACDLLIPKIGELIGGSEREYREEVLIQRCKDLGIVTEKLDWYIKLRRYGYYRSAGFGLGFERLVMYVTGTQNIKDTIPFYRSYNQIQQ